MEGSEAIAPTSVPVMAFSLLIGHDISCPYGRITMRPYGLKDADKFTAAGGMRDDLEHGFIVHAHEDIGGKANGEGWMDIDGVSEVTKTLKKESFGQVLGAGLET